MDRLSPQSPFSALRASPRGRDGFGMALVADTPTPGASRAYRPSIREMFRETKARTHEAMYHFESRGALSDDRWSSLVLWCLFGMSGWWASSCIMSQLPIFVVELHGGLALGNQLAMMTQLGNVFSISYTALRHFSIRLFDADLVVQAMMWISFFSLIACARFWDVLVLGHNLPLMCLAFLIGGMGCMADVTYWVFVLENPPRCTKAVSIGMTLGGLVSSGVAVVQLRGRSFDYSLFGPTVFFCAAALIQLFWIWVVVRVNGSCSIGLFNGFASAGNRDFHRLNMASTSGIPFRLMSGSDSDVSVIRVLSNRSGRPSNDIGAILELWTFLIYAATYTMPTLMPFVSGAYQSHEIEQLLLWMLTCQNAGDVLGRFAAPVSRSETWICRVKLALARCSFFAFPVIFLFFIAGAVKPGTIGTLIPFPVASVLLPALSLAFYFCRGSTVTVLFLRARQVAKDQGGAEHIASTMGFCGQMGALSANVVAFFVVNVLSPG